MKKPLRARRGNTPREDEPLGLREHTRLRTDRTISETAIALFPPARLRPSVRNRHRGPTEVSQRTLFTYFPSKDDLILHRISDTRTKPPESSARALGEALLDALHRHLRSALTRRNPITGLCDTPDVVAFYRLIINTPSLTGCRGGSCHRGPSGS
jgi:hypothetical protein